MVTDSSGTVIDNVTYAPYGEITQGGAVSRFDYEGKEYSSVVGDYDFHFRKYCVQFGIFCQPDTLIQNVYDPQSLNRYMFERGNPYNKVDEDGHAWQYVVAGIIGAAWNTYEYHASNDVHTTKGYIGYGLAGFLVGASSLTGAEGAAVGGAAATGIERYVDEKSLFDVEARTEYLASAAISAATFGLGKFLPQAKTWLIKSPTSYVTTKTGNLFIQNQIIEKIFISILENFNQKALGTSKSGGRSAFGSKTDKSAIRDLAEASKSKNAKGKTAGQIIREWRAKQSSKR